jgi:hyperosmotically inducible protein
VTKAGEKTGEAVGTAAKKTGNVLSKTGEVINDAWITTKVKAKMAGDDPLKGSNIDVDTKDNVVTLSGTVPTEQARAYALAKAREIEGVKKVIDKLAVAPKTE